MLFQEIVPIPSTWDQMADIDGEPYFRISFFMLGWTSYEENARRYVNVSIVYKYPYQPSLVPTRPTSIRSYDTIKSQVLSTMLEAMEPSREDSHEMINGIATMSWIESSIMNFTSDSPSITGKITSIDIISISRSYFSLL